MKLGELEFHIISAGHVLLDGGAMFGVIPRPLWEKKMQPDARNRITLSMNCFLIHAGGKRILVETGAGDKMNAKVREFSLQKIPFVLIMGDKEAAGDAVSVRTRGKGDEGSVGLAEFIERAKRLVAEQAPQL